MMTVGDLIKKLENYNPDYRVCIETDFEGHPGIPALLVFSGDATYTVFSEMYLC